MTTPILVRGWEHGLATLSINGGGLASVLAGSTISVQGTIKRTGDYAIRFNKAAAGNCYVAKAVTTPNLVVGSLYVYFTTFPATNNDDICFCNVTAGATLGLKINTLTKKIYARFWGVADGNTADLALSAGVWYRIDYKFDVSTGSSKIDFQVDGTAATQSTYTQAATTFTNVGIGSTNTNTSDWYVDDEVYSITSNDYPIGTHVIAGLRPSGDGTHNNAANIMEDSAGNDIDGITYVAASYLDEKPWIDGANDYVRQTGNGTGNYCEILFADMPSASSVLGATALLQYYSASATANTGGCIIIDEDATNTTLWGAPGALADYSESSRFYKSVQLPTPAGGWDEAAVNALKCRFGYSDDANPDPYWQAIIVEVAYVAGTAPTTINLSAAAVAAGGQALTVTPGAVSTTLSAAALTSSGPQLAVQTITTLVMASATLAAGGQAIGITPGAISTALLAAALAAQGQTITIDAGGIAPTTINLSAAALAAGGQTITITPGAVSLALVAAALAASGQTITLQPGAVSIALAAALASATGQAITISAPSGLQVNLGAAGLVASGQTLGITPGAVSMALSAGAISAQGQALDAQPGTASIVLASALLQAAGQTITISAPAGGMMVNLNAATITASGQSITIDVYTALIILHGLMRSFILNGHVRDFVLTGEERSFGLTGAERDLLLNGLERLFVVKGKDRQ